MIAFASGGALDTVVDGETGVFFREQTPEALSEAVARFERIQFDPYAIQQHARRFSTERFRRELGAYVATEYEAFRSKR